jgi:uncharacterized membrane protein YbhN (UPF0104 family)
VLVELVDQPGLMRLTDATRAAIVRMVRDLRAAITASHDQPVAAVLYGHLRASGRYAALVTAAETGDDAPLRRVASYYFGGMYLNLFGPGTVTGDVGRSLFLADGRRRGLALSTVAAHRAFGLVALVWVSAAALLLTRELPLPRLARLFAALAIPATLAAWLVGPRLVARILPPTNALRRLVEHDLAPYWRDPRLLGASLTLAMLVHVLQIGGQMAVGHALGLVLPGAVFWVVVPILNALSTLPFSLSGLGVREAGYWYALPQLGVAPGSAVAVGLLTSAIVLVTGLCGLPFFLLTRRAPRRITR